MKLDRLPDCLWEIKTLDTGKRFVCTTNREAREIAANLRNGARYGTGIYTVSKYSLAAVPEASL